MLNLGLRPTYQTKHFDVRLRKYYYYYYYYYSNLMASFQDNLGSWYQKSKTSLDLNETRNDGVSGGSRIS